MYHHFYDNNQLTRGLSPIPKNIIWTDNCPTQYQYCQNFRNIVTYATATSTRIHKFGSKYRFNGSWDAFGKLIKQKIFNNEMIDDRCANTLDCYKKLRKSLSKDGTVKTNRKLLEYKDIEDAHLHRKCTF